MMLKKIIHRLCDYPLVSNIIRNTIEAGMITVRRNLSRAAGNTRKKRVLDMACGTGEFSCLAEGEYVGVDLDKKHILYARKKYGTKKKKFLVRDASKTGFPDNHFDITFLINFIHHLPDKEFAKVFKEAKRVTKGRIIVSDVIPLKYNPIGKFFHKMDQGANIRTLKAQKSLIGKHARITRLWKPFRSGMNIHTIIVCDPNH